MLSRDTDVYDGVVPFVQVKIEEMSLGRFRASGKINQQSAGVLSVGLRCALALITSLNV